MYFSNLAYIDRVRDEIVDLEHPITVTSCGYYKVYTGLFKTERPMGRSDYQLLYVAAGKAHYFIDGVKRTVGKGHMVLYLPGDAQKYIYYGEDNPEVYWVHFTGSDADSFLGRFALPKGDKIFFAGNSVYYQWLYRQMIQELQLRRANCAELLNIMLEHILLLVDRYIKEGQSAGAGVIDDIERATHYFNENYSKQISIEEYAKQCHMSTCWFIKSFKAITKMTPMQYVVSLRMTNAMNLLDNTKYSISKVAAAVGYDDALYFSRLFRKRMGMTPTEYRSRER